MCAYTERRWDLVLRALASLQAQEPAPHEVILVVDHNERFLQRANEELAGVTIIPNDDVKGLAGARNSGVRAASGDVVAFLDDDASADPGWIEHLRAPYRDPAVQGTGGMVRAEWPPAGRPEWFPAEFGWVVGCSYTGLPSVAGPVRNLIGANMSFRREAIESVGLFSTGIGRSATAPLGCEETELSIRLAQQDPTAMLWYEPAASVGHAVSEPRVQPGYFLRRCLAEGLSKALVSTMVGASDATASERDYVRTVLPRAMWRAARGVFHRRPGQLGMLAALIGGLGVTTLGYGLGRFGLGSQALRLIDSERRAGTTQEAGAQ